MSLGIIEVLVYYTAISKDAAVTRLFRNFATAIVIVAIWVTFVSATERLVTNLDRNEGFLPFVTERAVSLGWTPDRKRIGISGRVVQIADSAHARGLFVTAYNPIFGEDVPAQVGIREFPGNALVRDIPVWLTLTDLLVYTDSTTGAKSVMVLGYRRDSAYAMRVFPGESHGRLIFLGTGKDSTGDGSWNPDVLWVQSYEQAGFTHETFLTLGTSRDGGERKLICLDPSREIIKWTLPVAGTVPPGEMRFGYSHGQRYTMFTTGSPSQGKRDTLFSDHQGYFVSVDTTGRIRHAAIIKSFLSGAFLAQLDSISVYCAFDLPFTRTDQEPDSLLRSSRIARVLPDGVVSNLIEVGARVNALCAGRYQNQPVIFAQVGLHRVNVYDTSLRLVAESDSISGLSGTLAVVQVPSASSPLLFMSIEYGGVIVSPHFEKLMKINSPGMTNCQPMVLDRTGRVMAFLASGATEVAIVTVTPSSLWKKIEIIYVDHRELILSGVIGLIVLLVVVNAFRSRNRRTLSLVASQKKELEAAHAALKEAQAELVATEKYRQAKDIAGGFAHEIRNALFPAEAALVKLRSTVMPTVGQDDKVGRYLFGASQAVSRAINATRLISEYTKLDTQYLPESVKVMGTVTDVIKANQLRFAEQGVNPTTSGDAATIVEANSEQLTVALNNLVSNSLDAIRAESGGLLLIAWYSSEDAVSIEVSDNGPGVPIEQVNRIFDTFYSTKPNTGTGLGLPIARKIVELYGGTLTYRRAADLTIFTITLPINKGNPIEDSKK